LVVALLDTPNAPTPEGTDFEMTAELIETIQKLGKPVLFSLSDGSKIVVYEFGEISGAYFVAKRWQNWTTLNPAASEAADGNSADLYVSNASVATLEVRG
jgi:hypothetical protein